MFDTPLFAKCAKQCLPSLATNRISFLLHVDYSATDFSNADVARIENKLENSSIDCFRQVALMECSNGRP